MTATPSTSTDVVEIPVGKLDSSPWQTRHFPRKDPALGDLAASIKKVGVLQPVLVRMKGQRFQILAGERRVRAARRAKLATVPSIVRDVDDNTAAEICVVENLQREDLGVIEEGHAVALLLEREAWTTATVGAQIGRSPEWVARRASLWTRLSEAWKKVASTPGHPAHGWPAARLELIARIDPDEQDAILKKNKRAETWFWSAGSSEIRREIDTRIRALAVAPWNLDDAALVSDAGACDVCPHRASQAALLFDNVTDDPKTDQCLRPPCWSKKITAHFKAIFAAHVEANGKPPILVVSYSSGGIAKRLGKDLPTVNRWDIGPAKARPFKGSKPMLFCDPSTDHYGRIMHAKKTRGAHVGTTRKQTVAEKRRTLSIKRLKEGATAVVHAIGKAKRSPKPKEIAALSALFHLSDGYHEPGTEVDVVARFTEAMSGTKQYNALLREVWIEDVVDGLADQAQYQTWDVDRAEGVVSLASHVAGLVGVDPAPLVAKAITDNPEPASWSKKKTTKKKATKKGGAS